MSTIGIGPLDLWPSLKPHLDAIALALAALLECRHSSRRRYRDSLNASQSNHVDQQRWADIVFETKASEASKRRRKAIETEPDNVDCVLQADVEYFASVRSSEAIHSEHRRILASAKESADMAARDTRDREYQAAEAWFLSTVRREIEDAIQDAIARKTETES